MSEPGNGGGLPAAWSGRDHWTVLATRFGSGLDFLTTWRAWQADPVRPRLLHFVAAEALPVSPSDLLRSAQAYPTLLPLAERLAAQWRGLLPGQHRLVFEGGRVLLTLCVGPLQAVLRECAFAADSVLLGDPAAAATPVVADTSTLKAVARLCHRHTLVTAATATPELREALTQCAFVLDEDTNASAASGALRARFDPRWTPRSAPAFPPHGELPAARDCVVIGGGLAGASVAASLARRGWAVRVLDNAAEPAAGASGLPAGLFAPHVSPDDAVVSRLTRAGGRAMREQLEALLREGTDWQASGVLEHRVEPGRDLPADWPEAGRDWTTAADPAAHAQACLPPGARALWHGLSGWVKPAALVRALLAQPGITWRGGLAVARLQRVLDQWKLFDAKGDLLDQAPLVVVAAGPMTRELAGDTLPLQSVRGQLSWGLVGDNAGALPPFPVNGLGSLLPGVPSPEGPAWYCGSTFERGSAEAVVREADHAVNFERLHRLLPKAAGALAPQFQAPSTRGWAGVRCTAPDRLPLVGPVDTEAVPGLWASTAMGARGLSLAVLCGELLAARLHGEPLPVEIKLARALAADRFRAAARAVRPA